jgi:hypothetical protein
MPKQLMQISTQLLYLCTDIREHKIGTMTAQFVRCIHLHNNVAESISIQVDNLNPDANYRTSQTGDQAQDS